MRKPRADPEQQLEKYRRELAEAREHLAEALERETATSGVLRVISSSPGKEVTMSVSPEFWATEQADGVMESGTYWPFGRSTRWYESRPSKLDDLPNRRAQLQALCNMPEFRELTITNVLFRQAAKEAGPRRAGRKSRR
jgi:hypothetical protein